jgi:hypothetical protein
MKKTELIDVLPTVFVMVALIGALNNDLWSESSIGPIMFYGGGALAFLVSVAGIVKAKHGQKLQGIRILNLAWILFAILFFAWFLVVRSTWHNLLG